MGWDASTVPDPQDPETFERSRSSTGRSGTPRAGRHCLRATRALTRLRRTLPALTDPDLRRTSVDHSEAERWLVLRRGVGQDAAVVVVNLSDQATDGPPRRRP